MPPREEREGDEDQHIIHSLGLPARSQRDKTWPGGLGGKGRREKRGKRTRNATRVILNTNSIVMDMVEDNLGQVLRLDVFSPSDGVNCLHDDHVSTITSFLK